MVILAGSFSVLSLFDLTERIDSRFVRSQRESADVLGRID